MLGCPLHTKVAICKLKMNVQERRNLSSKDNAGFGWLILQKLSMPTFQAKEQVRICDESIEGKDKRSE